MARRRTFLLRMSAALFAAILASSGRAAERPAADQARPVIPAFERFFTDADADRVRGGQLLLGELNCTSCHAADEMPDGYVIRRQAPVLDDVGRRVRVEYLRAFIAKPQVAAPGSTMPGLFAGKSPDETRQQVEALVHFLAAGGTVADEQINPQAVARGSDLFHRVGCVACHAPRQADLKLLPPHSVPLGELAAKYALPSLTQFLQNPHQVRPAGRMPSLNLVGDEAKDIASFLLQGIEVPTREPNVRFAAYEGRWENLPDFGELKPYKTGTTAAFDLTPAGRTSNFGMRFDGFLHVPQDGDYTFHLGSDDASKLWLDGKLIVDNNGVHPHQVRSGGAKLAAGPHAVRIDYAQVGGEWSLELHYEGPDVPRQPAYASISADKNGPSPAAASKDDKGPGLFVLNAELVKQGRALFAELGCASCHQKQENGQPIAGALKAPPLAKLKNAAGCLAEAPGPGLPHYALSGSQRESLAASVSVTPAQPLDDEARVGRTLAAFNCYACHERGETGGVEKAREPLFLGTIPEMGDEGRIPPHLNGVGDKLNLGWLKHVMENGANDRPYMHTRMPKFGAANVGYLADAFARLDAVTEVEIPAPLLPPLRTKATGRFIVGEQALSCIKCHNFGQHQATGIQSIDLQTMTRRLRPDWFHRYMLKPFRYRPGTRMPTGFPNGKSVIPKVLGGDTHQQLLAIWEYLADGNKAPVPLGLLKQAIVLVPEDEPIVYRNFLEGLSPRGIAVGYPEKAHLAFDADQLCIALIWHGAFIDASMHWSSRGAGYQRPLGDHVVSLVRGVSLAALESGDAAWPEDSAEKLGFRFRGYRFDKQRRPVFRYGSDSIDVEDHSQPVPGDPDAGLKRTLTVSVNEPVEGLWYRAAAGAKIEQRDGGWFVVDDVLRVRVASGTSEPVVRKSGDRFELVMPLALNGKPVVIVQEYAW